MLHCDLVLSIKIITWTLTVFCWKWKKKNTFLVRNEDKSFWNGTKKWKVFFFTSFLCFRVCFFFMYAIIFSRITEFFPQWKTWLWNIMMGSEALSQRRWKKNVFTLRQLFFCRPRSSTWWTIRNIHCRRSCISMKSHVCFEQNNN